MDLSTLPLAETLTINSGSIITVLLIIALVLLIVYLARRA